MVAITARVNHQALGEREDIDEAILRWTSMTREQARTDCINGFVVDASGAPEKLVRRKLAAHEAGTMGADTNTPIYKQEAMFLGVPFVDQI